MAIYRTNICVGGPMDGKRHDATEANRFRVAIPEPGSMVTFPPPYGPVKTVDIWYLEARWEVAGSEFTFWMAEGMSYTDAVERVLSAYASRRTSGCG